MKTDIEKKLAEIRIKKMTDTESSRVWSLVEDGYVKKNASILTTVSRNNNMIKKIIALALIFGMTGATAYASNDAKPGDFLFPLDRGVENLRITLASNEKRDDLRIKFATERLEEIDEILGEPLTVLVGASTAADAVLSTSTHSSNANGGDERVERDERDLDNVSEALFLALELMNSVESEDGEIERDITDLVERFNDRVGERTDIRVRTNDDDDDSRDRSSDDNSSNDSSSRSDNDDSDEDANEERVRIENRDDGRIRIETRGKGERVRIEIDGDTTEMRSELEETRDDSSRSGGGRNIDDSEDDDRDGEGTEEEDDRDSQDDENGSSNQADRERRDGDSARTEDISSRLEGLNSGTQSASAVIINSVSSSDSINETTKIEVQIKGKRAEVVVEINDEKEEFELMTDDMQKIIFEISSRFKMSEEVVEQLLDF